MTSFVEIDGKKFQSVKDAASLSGYSRDYIGRLAREQEIAAQQIGRQWFVSMDSLENYAKIAEQDSKDRQRKLSELRRNERQAAAQRKSKRAQNVQKKKERIKTRGLAVSVLALGVGLGVFLNATTLMRITPERQVATAPQGDVFPQNQKEFPIATGEVKEAVAPETINFSKESMTISTLDGDGYGVMLLPAESDKKISEAEMKQMFSDPVSIVLDEAGNRYVVRITADGTEERLPFAVVPVDNQETP